MEIRFLTFASHTKRLLNGDLGKRKIAWETYQGVKWMDRCGEKDAENYGGEINLFILAPALRGMGYGCRLMDRLIESCNKHKVDSVFLWTTTMCTLQIYDHYGFREHSRFPIDVSPEEGNIT